MTFYQDPDEKHIMHSELDVFVKVFGLRILRNQVHTKFFGPAHLLTITNYTIFNIFSFKVKFIGSIINTGPLSLKVVTHYVPGQSILDTLLVRFGQCLADMAVSIDFLPCCLGYFSNNIDKYMIYTHFHNRVNF